MKPDEMRLLLDSWLLSQRAERKSPNTIRNRRDGVNRFLEWCAETGTEPELTRTHVVGFVAARLDRGLEASTVVSNQAAVRRFSAWLAAEGETSRDDLIGLKPPKLDAKVVPELTADQLRALIKVCRGPGFRERRDEAIIRFMSETLARANEVIGMTVPDTDLKDGSTVIRRGKGGKGRRVPFGPQTGHAIDRYVRARRTHRLASAPALWLGDRGKMFSYDGLYSMLKRRAVEAGLPAEFTPHWLRHTGAGRWLDAGGSEGGLMAVGGWARREMIDRYTKATSERRAAEESRRLGLGDL